jgi:hypothetical protein
VISRRTILRLPALLALGAVTRPRAESAAPLVALGDSILALPGSPAGRIAAALGRTLDNRAIIGATLAEQADVWRGAPDGDAVAIVGANEAYRHGSDPTAFAALLAELCALRVARGRLWVGCLPMASYDTAPYRAAVADVAAQTSAVCVDLSWYDAALLSPGDGIHPGVDGQIAIAAAFLARVAGICLSAAPALAVSVSARGVVSWDAPAGQARAAVVLRRAGVDTFLGDAGAGGAYVLQAAPGELVTVTAWDSDGALLGVGRGAAPYAVWLPVARR